MAYYPFMIDVEEKKCVIVGGGKVAYRKMKGMLEMGARVTMIAPEFVRDILDYVYVTQGDFGMDEKSGIPIGSTETDKAVVQAETESRLRLVTAEAKEEDLAQADFAIIATNQTELNSRLAKYCRNNRILVNVVDVQEECSFIVPALLQKDPVLVAVSTAGQSPVMAGKIRDLIDRAIPDSYIRTTRQLGEVREYVLSHVEESRRKAVFRRLAEIAIEEDRDIDIALIQDVMRKL